MERESFVFYKSWLDGIEMLPEEEQLNAYRAIVRYACLGEEPEVSGVANIILTMAKPQIDANNKRYSDGRRGGRPRSVEKQKTSGIENENQRNENEKPNVYVYVNDNDNVNDNENVNVNENVYISDSQASKKDQPSEDPIPYQAIIDTLNQKTGSRYRVTAAAKKLIHARFAEGFTAADFTKVIENMTAAWGGDERMRTYLRPQTLFSTKFDSYLQDRHRTYISGDLPY